MPQTLCFLLLPGFSMMGLMAAIEPLRVANRFRGELYRWRLLSLDGAAVAASNGMSLNVDTALELPAAGASLFVVAGFEPLASFDARLAHWLHRAEREGVLLGGIDTGSFVLAEAGLLDGHRLTLHWEAIDAFKESYPHLTVTQELFEIDRRRITCAGGTASIDLMLDLIAQAHGPQLAIQVSEQFVLGRIRPRKDHQRMEVATRYGISNKKLVHVIGEMEQHSEPPLTTLSLVGGGSRSAWWAQLLADTVAKGMDWAMDKPLTPSLAKDIIETINSLGRNLKAAGVVLGFEAWYDETANPVDSLKAGKLVIRYKYTVPPPLEDLGFQQEITDEYFADFAAQLTEAG